MPTATTYREYAEKLERLGATVGRWSLDTDIYFTASKDGKQVELFFDADRFQEAVVLDEHGEPIRRTLRSMAAVERYLGIS